MLKKIPSLMRHVFISRQHRSIAADNFSLKINDTKVRLLGVHRKKYSMISWWILTTFYDCNL